MLRREVPAGATVVRTTAVDVIAAVAFMGGLASAVLMLVSRAWVVPAVLVVLTTAPRRSTRAVAWWTAVGLAIGIIALAFLLALLATGPHAAND